jgi:hypothetical protein
MDAPQGTQAAWREFAGCKRPEGESPYLQKRKLLDGTVFSLTITTQRYSKNEEGNETVTNCHQLKMSEKPVG